MKQATISNISSGRKDWQAPFATHVGRISEVLQGGGGKLSPQGGDPGECRVPKPGDPANDPNCS